MSAVCSYAFRSSISPMRTGLSFFIILTCLLVFLERPLPRPFTANSAMLAQKASWSVI